MRKAMILILLLMPLMILAQVSEREVLANKLFDLSVKMVGQVKLYKAGNAEGVELTDEQKADLLRGFDENASEVAGLVGADGVAVSSGVSAEVYSILAKAIKIADDLNGKYYYKSEHQENLDRLNDLKAALP